MRALLESMYKFAGEPEQKPGDQVKGTEQAKSTKSGKDHPFKGRLVGAAESCNFLADLDKTAKETKTKRDLEERWAEFKEAMLGVHDKRPSRKGSRPPRGHEPQPRYKTFKSPDTNKKA